MPAPYIGPARQRIERVKALTKVGLTKAAIGWDGLYFKGVRAVECRGAYWRNAIWIVGIF
jgi:hypothetical protein